MTIQDMQFDVKLKLNKLDSNAFRGLLGPELDWKLNEAHTIYINNAIASKRPNGLGLEMNERLTGDISPLLVKSTIIPVNGVAKLPTNYRNFVKAEVRLRKGSCVLDSRVWLVQHEDLSSDDFFSKPSFEWQEANAYFEKEGLVLKVDGTIVSMELTYVKKHPYVHNAIGFDPGGYRLPSGQLLQGFQNSELPDHVHGEIVDIAVALTANELGLPTNGVLTQKMTITN